MIFTPVGPVASKEDTKLIKVLNQPDKNIETTIGQLVGLDSFYTFWTIKGSLIFWDGYSDNSNNFFFYLHPETDKFHFIPWGQIVYLRDIVPLEMIVRILFQLRYRV